MVEKCNKTFSIVWSKSHTPCTKTTNVTCVMQPLVLLSSQHTLTLIWIKSTRVGLFYACLWLHEKSGGVSLTISFKLCIECCDAGVCYVIHTFVVYTSSVFSFGQCYSLPKSVLVYVNVYLKMLLKMWNKYPNKCFVMFS